MMIVNDKMLGEAEIFCEQSMSVLDGQHLCAPKAAVENDFLKVPSPSSVFSDARASESLRIEISHSESAVTCSRRIKTTLIESSITEFVPSIRSGSHMDTGSRKFMEDEHIRIDDLSTHLGSMFRCPLPSAFYAVFDGHGGSEAAAYVKNNATRLFLEDADLPQTSYIDDAFLEELENSHRRAFLLADKALAAECSVAASCGATVLTALVLGRHLMVANAGDCRAVLCRKGVAVPMSQDHRYSFLPERKRVEDLGGYFEYGYLNGELAVTRALGDWYMKSLHGAESPLIADPDVQKVMLMEEDEFLILCCDGIWDVMSNQEAVNLVRRELTLHDDPERCARELVNQALRLHTTDNLTAIVVCFTSPDPRDSPPPCRPRSRCLSLSEEARNRLRRLLEDN